MCEHSRFSRRKFLRDSASGLFAASVFPSILQAGGGNGVKGGMSLKNSVER